MASTAAAGGRGRFSERTAWARNVTAPLRDFLSTEAGGSFVLLGATVAALLWANSPGRPTSPSGPPSSRSALGSAGISQDLHDWVNNGLMTFFFLVLGLEAKREIDVGELRERRRVVLPLLRRAVRHGDVRC